MPVTCLMTRLWATLTNCYLKGKYRQIMSPCECWTGDKNRCDRTTSTKPNTNPKNCLQYQHCRQFASSVTETKIKVKTQPSTEAKTKIKVPIEINSQPMSPNFDTIQYPFQGAHMIQLLGKGIFGIVPVEPWWNIMVLIPWMYKKSLRGCENLLQLLGPELLYDVQSSMAKVNIMVTWKISLRSSHWPKESNMRMSNCLTGCFNVKSCIEISRWNIFLDYDYDLTYGH